MQGGRSGTGGRANLGLLGHVEDEIIVNDEQSERKVGKGFCTDVEFLAIKILLSVFRATVLKQRFWVKGTWESNSLQRSEGKIDGSR